MATINKLSAADSLEAGDQVVVYDSSNGDARKASLSLLKSWMEENLQLAESQPVFETQRSAPSATGFSVSVTDSDANTHLILTPLDNYAAGTIVLPSSTNAVDKQEVLVTCTKAVTTLTVNANGASSIYGAPSSLSAHSFFKLKYDLGTQTWIRVG